MADLVTASHVRVALVGCGRIAPAHLAALRSAGCVVTALAGSPGSVRARAFAEANAIPTTFDTLDDLAASELWDAAVVATSVETTVEVTRSLAASGRPLLVEKPIGLRAAVLEPLHAVADQVIVGYNRRFYRSVEAAREFVDSHAPVLAEVVIPETLPAPVPGSDPLRPFFANSVHVLDLVRFLFPGIDVVRTRQARGDGGTVVGLGALLESVRGDLVMLTANWNAPDNFRITLSSGDERFELRPLEVGQRYRGMTVRPPDAGAGRTVKEYQPTPVDPPVSDDTGGKPGFDAQAAAFARFVTGGDPGPAARLGDAVAVLRLAEDLAGIDHGGER